MRLHIRLAGRNVKIPFNHLPQMVGTIHKWIGRNNEHDTLSLYSFSWLRGGKKRGDFLTFEEGATFFFSSHEVDLVRKFVSGIQTDPSAFFGFWVSEVTIQETPQFSERETFHLASPALVKRRVDNHEVHFTYENPESSILLTETFKTKLRQAGISDEGVSIDFKSDYIGARTKLVYYNKIGNRVNECPVTVSGSKEQVRFAWNVGIGNSTGIGFGALK